MKLAVAITIGPGLRFWSVVVGLDRLGSEVLSRYELEAHKNVTCGLEVAPVFSAKRVFCTHTRALSCHAELSRPQVSIGPSVHRSDQLSSAADVKCPLRICHIIILIFLFNNHLFSCAPGRSARRDGLVATTSLGGFGGNSLSLNEAVDNVSDGRYGAQELQIEIGYGATHLAISEGTFTGLFIIFYLFIPFI